MRRTRSGSGSALNQMPQQQQRRHGQGMPSERDVVPLGEDAAVGRCRLPHQLDPALKALVLLTPGKYIPFSRRWFQIVNLHPYTADVVVEGAEEEVGLLRVPGRLEKATTSEPAAQQGKHPLSVACQNHVRHFRRRTAKVLPYDFRLWELK